MPPAITAPLAQAARFGVVGAANTVVGLAAIYTGMLLFGLGLAAANVAGYAVGLACSFFLNRSWTFRSQERLLRVAPRFALAALCAWLLNLAAVLAAVRFAGVNPFLAQTLGVVVYTVAMFAGCRAFVFRVKEGPSAATP